MVTNKKSHRLCKIIPYSRILLPNPLPNLLHMLAYFIEDFAASLFRYSFCLLQSFCNVRTPIAKPCLGPFNPAPPFLKVHNVLDSLLDRRLWMLISIAYCKNCLHLNMLRQIQYSSYLFLIKSPYPARS